MLPWSGCRRGGASCGIGPPSLEAVKVTDGDITVVVDTDEGDDMTAFVVWWRGSGNPGSVVPDYRVQPSS